MALPHRIGYSELWITASGLIIYSIILTLMTGNTGFEGDDWWVFSVPYWHSFPESIWIYASEFLRPVEGIYWIGMFEIFGFNRTAFHFFSLLLLSAGSILMGLSLSKTFPGNRAFIILCVLFSFFLPMVCSLTYVVFTDNSRLCSVFFWVSVLLYQRWVSKGCAWTGLFLPSILYVISFLTYESCSLLIFTVPLLLIPIHNRMEYRLPDFSFLARLATGILIAFSTAIVLRFTLLNGGAVAHNHLFPPVTLILSYLGLLPFYLAAPFSPPQNDLWSWSIGIMLAVFAAAFIYLRNQTNERALQNNSKYIIFLGLCIFLLGMLPYQLAGYGSVIPDISETFLTKAGVIDGSTKWFSFDAMSRIYSSASFGIAIIIAAVLTLWRSPWQRKLSASVAALILGCMIAFHVGLRVDWKEAAQIRNDIVKSLITQVPNVIPNTNLIFLDLECNHKRAAVFRGWIGLRSLISMLYHQHTVNAWYLYPYSWSPPNSRYPQSVVSPAGFWSRGMQAPARESSLIILKRYGRDLVPLNKISESDGQAPTGISWVERSSIHTNTDRIIAWADIDKDPQNFRNAWSTGFISTLNLARLNVPFLWRTNYFETINLTQRPRYVLTRKSIIPRKLQ
jgi:hypothetical protein